MRQVCAVAQTRGRENFQHPETKFGTLTPERPETFPLCFDRPR